MGGSSRQSSPRPSLLASACLKGVGDTTASIQLDVHNLPFLAYQDITMYLVPGTESRALPRQFYSPELPTNLIMACRFSGLISEDHNALIATLILIAARQLAAIFSCHEWYLNPSSSKFPACAFPQSQIFILCQRPCAGKNSSRGNV